MVVKRIEPRRRFTAFDEDGNEYTIIELVKILDSSTLDDPDGEAEGRKMFRTADGQPVNYRGKGKYQLVVNGKMLFSDDEDAP
jgi:hypothetical protein